MTGIDFQTQQAGEPWQDATASEVPGTNPGVPGHMDLGKGSVETTSDV